MMNRLDKNDGVKIDELSVEGQKKMIRNIVNLGGDRVDPKKLENLSLDIYLQNGGIYANIQKILNAVRKEEDMEEEPVDLFVRQDTGEQVVFPFQENELKEGGTEEGMFRNKKTGKMEAVPFPLYLKRPLDDPSLHD